MHRKEQWRSLLTQADSYYNSVSEPERQLMRDWVQGLLREGEVIIDFVKADGDFRSMKCTLSEVLGAKYTVNENKSSKKPNPEVCVVWDLNREAWRSFRWDRLKKVTFEIG